MWGSVSISSGRWLAGARSAGVDAARAAGMDVVYVLRGRPASSCPRADYYVERFDQIGVGAGAGAPFVIALR